MQNDRFTVSDTSIGNAALTYPIGTITGDEAAMAGLVYGVNNSTNFLYTSKYYWTLSPHYISLNLHASNHVVGFTGGLSTTFVIDGGIAIRPVLSINSQLKVIGEGTNTNPFKIIY